LFLANHSPFPYYVSGYALSILKRFFATRQLDPAYRRFKHHMLMLFRILNEKSDLPYLNNKKGMDAYCSALIEVITDKSSALEGFKRAVSSICAAMEKGYDRREAVRLRAFTTELVTVAQTGKAPRVAAVERELGTVVWFSAVRGYGFIHADRREQDVFVHYNDIRGEGYRSLEAGQRVEFTVHEVKKGYHAEDVLVRSAAVRQEA
jgi:CspA family cold shock protein